MRAPILKEPYGSNVHPSIHSRVSCLVGNFTSITVTSIFRQTLVYLFYTLFQQSVFFFQNICRYQQERDTVRPEIRCTGSTCDENILHQYHLCTAHNTCGLTIYSITYCHIVWPGTVRACVYVNLKYYILIAKNLYYHISLTGSWVLRVAQRANLISLFAVRIHYFLRGTNT